jgi:hypothetical protein
MVKISILNSPLRGIYNPSLFIQSSHLLSSPRNPFTLICLAISKPNVLRGNQVTGKRKSVCQEVVIRVRKKQFVLCLSVRAGLAHAGAKGGVLEKNQVKPLAIIKKQVVIKNAQMKQST